MTEGHGGDDERAVDGADHSRGHGEHSDREDILQENRYESGETAEPSTARDGRTRTDERHAVNDREGAVEFAEGAGIDSQWIDLGENPPDGKALAASELSAEKLTEFTTDRRSLSPLVQIHWGLRVSIGAAIATALATWGLGAAGYNTQFGAVIFGLLLVSGLLWVILYYRLWVYQVRADAIYLERGVLTHVRSLVPYVRIQHVDTSQSPIERLLGLSRLVVYTAGSRGADVSIPGLRPEEARDLQNRVKQLAIEAEGDDAL